MKLFRALFIVLFVLHFSVVSPLSQELTGSGDSPVAAELKALAASVDRLSRILESSVGSNEQDLLFQKLNLAVAYLNFRSRRIESLEQDMQSAKNAKNQIESTLNVWLQQQEEMAADDSALLSEEIRQRNEEFQLRINMVKGRVARLDNEIVVLENKIYELQGQIDSVEEFVQKNLNL